MAATAASFSGWTFIGHPGLIWRDGIAYAFASFYVLTMPITGTFFAKRNWLLDTATGQTWVLYSSPPTWKPVLYDRSLLPGKDGFCTD